MFKKVVSVTLLALLTNLVAAPVSADSTKETSNSSGDRAKSIARIKKGISELGTGKESCVEVKLQDERKLTGYLGEISQDHFVVVDAKTGARVSILYPQVKKVKGKNHLSGKQIAITVVVVALFVIPLLIWAKSKGT